MGDALLDRAEIARTAGKLPAAQTLLAKARADGVRALSMSERQFMERMVQA